MSNLIRKGIGEEIKRITGTDKQDSFPVMSGVVKRVNESALTCVVLLSTDYEQPTEGIILNAVSDEENGFILFPAVGSTVWVAEVDGPGKLGVVKCSKITKVKLGTDVEVVINGGSNGGMVKVQALVSKINALEQDLNTLKSVFSGWIVAPNDGGLALKAAAATWYAGTLTPTQVNDLKNDKVKH